MKFGIQIPPPPASNKSLSGITGGRLNMQVGKSSFTIDVPKNALSEATTKGGTFQNSKFTGDSGESITAEFRYVDADGNLSQGELVASTTLVIPPTDPEGRLKIIPEA